MAKGIIESVGEQPMVKFIDYDGFGTHQGFENVTEYPFEVGQEVEVWHTTCANPLITKVFVDHKLVVDLPGEYLSLKHEYYMVKGKVEQYREYLRDKMGYPARLAALHPWLRDRLQSIIDKNSDFYKEPMGMGYELFLSEQADLLVRSFQDPEIRRGVKESGALIPDNPTADSFSWHTGNADWDVDNPVDALIAWYALNSKVNDYRYKEQVALVPGWSDGHSGMTAGAAYSFAKHILGS